MTEPEIDQPTWRIRSGVGLLADAPMSEERRAAFRKEEERERKALELEAEQRQQAAIERDWELTRQGFVPRTVSDVIAAAAAAQDRRDRRDAKRDADAAEVMGRPVPGLNRWEMKAAQAEREAAKETTPATQAELGRLEQAVTQLKSKLHSLSGRTQDASLPQQGYRSGYHEPRPYVRTTGGPIVRGPY
jgi:hypothetical protein